MIITKSEFNKCMARLETATEPLGDIKAELYYERLKENDFNVLWKACTILLDNYKYKRFPSIGEIKDAMHDADRSIKYAKACEVGALEKEHFGEGPRCSRCEDTGWVVVNEYDEFYKQEHERAVNCSCPIGRARYDAWRTNPSKDLPPMKDRAYEYED
jgi:hypothetical protein